MSQFRRVGVPLESAPVAFPQMVRETIRSLADLVSNLAVIFDKGVGIDDNLDWVTVDFTSNGSANTEDAIAHTLGRIPVGYVVVSQDKAGSVYVSGTAFTSSLIYLKTSATSVAVKLRVF